MGFFFTRLRINFLLGWHYDFQKILGWLLVGYFKNEKILGSGILGCCNFKKNTRFDLLKKNTRLEFTRFSDWFQKIFGWALVGFSIFFNKYSVEEYLPVFDSITEISCLEVIICIFKAFCFFNVTNMVWTLLSSWSIFKNTQL